MSYSSSGALGSRAFDGCMPLHQSVCLSTGVQVICCSGARSTITADLSRVEEQGVSNLAAAFMDAQVRHLCIWFEASWIRLQNGWFSLGPAAC